MNSTPVRYFSDNAVFKVSFLAIMLFCYFPFQQASAQANVALNKTYILNPNPNYRLCTDSGDLSQLTDGIKRGSSWTKKSTVGWVIYRAIPQVTIDLGATLAVNEVRVYTVGGGAGNVRRPDFAIVLVSENGTDFYCAGAVGRFVGQESNQNQRSRSPHTFTIRGVNVNARFVRVILQPGSKFVFLDEIEVLSLPGATKNNSNAVTALPAFSDETSLFKNVEKQVQFSSDLDVVKTALLQAQAIALTVSKDLLQRIAFLREQAFGDSDRLHSSAELDNFYGDLALIRAETYQVIYGQPYVCMSAHPFENLYQNQMFTDGDIAENVNLKLWKNESEVAAINIISCSLQPITISASISSLVGLADDSRQHFEMRRGIYVKTRRKGSIADALVLLQDKPFTLDLGQATQIWFKFDSSGLDAGQYEASFVVSASLPDGKLFTNTTLPVGIKVASVSLPESIPISVCNWAYLMRSEITKNNITETAIDLKEHYTNVFVIPPADLPLPIPNSIKYGQSYTYTDNLIEANNYAKTYLFFLGFRIDRKDSARFGTWMSSSWKISFKNWLQSWADHLKKTGIGYDKFAIYPFDETLGDEFYQLAKLIKAIDPKIRIYANSFGKGPADFVRFKNLIDIWCFTLSHCQLHENWLETVKGFNKKVWLYNAMAWSKSGDPYGYYRLLPWWAFKYGLTGVGFWVYVDPISNQPSWDETNTPIGYYGVIYGKNTSPVNPGSETLIPSRRWEAWREGIEDYTFLYEFLQEINRVRGFDAASAEKAQNILNTQIGIVLGNPTDRENVYNAKNIITNKLIDLKSL